VRLSVAVLIAIGLGGVFATALVSENALRIPTLLREAPRTAVAEAVARETGSGWSAVEVTADDGAILRAWLFVPRVPATSAVILLHGVADSRRGVMSQALLLLRNGFTVLAPDSRGHGVSGGEVATYGLKEAGDVHHWAEWLFRNQHTQRLYGLGESMGAAILLQSLRAEPRFRAIVAECPFSTFEDIAQYRLSQVSGLGPLAVRPCMRLAFLYALLRYGVDLRQVSPADVVRTTRVPILLIHGEQDTNIPPSHSVTLHALNPTATRLWLVPNTRHVEAVVTHPAEFAELVVAWFRQ